MGDKQQVVLKIVKQLDSTMMRDIQEPPTLEVYQPEPPLDFLNIPTPTFSTSSPDTQEPIPDTQEDAEENYIPSLGDHCVKVLSESLSIDNALDMLEKADLNQIDELKVNTIKFISLNIVSFLESTNLARLYRLPVYLIRELENFLKADVIGKFGFFNMHQLDLLVEESLCQELKLHSTPTAQLRLTQEVIKEQY